MGIKAPHSEEKLERRRTSLVKRLQKKNTDWDELTCDECSVKERCEKVYHESCLDGYCINGL